MVGFHPCIVTAAIAAISCIPGVICAPLEDRAAPTSVPIAIGGKEALISEQFIQLMLPDYDVVHVINSAPVGRSEFVPLLKGEITIPVSGLGSNFNNLHPRIPKAIFIGGGFSQSEIDEMYEIKSLQTVPWLYPPTGSRVNGTIVPPTEFIAETVIHVFQEHGFVPGNVSNVKPAVWSF